MASGDSGQAFHVINSNRIDGNRIDVAAALARAQQDGYGGGRLSSLDAPYSHEDGVCPLPITPQYMEQPLPGGRHGISLLPLPPSTFAYGGGLAPLPRPEQFSLDSEAQATPARGHNRFCGSMNAKLICICIVSIIIIGVVGGGLACAIHASNVQTAASLPSAQPTNSTTRAVGEDILPGQGFMDRTMIIAVVQGDASTDLEAVPYPVAPILPRSDLP